MPLPKIDLPIFELKLVSLPNPIKFRPFLVKEEKLLLMALQSNDETTVYKTIKQVINNCLIENVDIDKIPIFDIEYLFLNIRAKSVGEVLEFSITCPDDGETQVEVEVNIDDIKVDIDKNHKDTIDLENGYFIKMKYPTMKYIMTKKDDAKNIVESTFEYAVECIDQIYNDEEVWTAADSTKKELSDFVENLNSKQYQKIQDFFNTMPKLKHVVPITNPKTGVKSDVTIEGLANFFA